MLDMHEVVGSIPTVSTRKRKATVRSLFLLFRGFESPHRIKYCKDRNAYVGKYREPHIGYAKETEQENKPLYAKGKNNVLPRDTYGFS